MRHALAYEWIRLRTVASTWWIVGVALVVTPLTCWAFAALILQVMSEQQTPVAVTEVLVVLLTKSPFPFLAAGLLGVFATAGEYRHGTIRATLLTTPRRGVALLAKAIVVALAGAAIAVASLLLCWAVILLYLPGRLQLRAPFDPVGRAQIGEVILVVGWALIGLALGAAIRSQTGAILALMAGPYVVEPLLRAGLGSSSLTWVAGAANYLPFIAGNAMVGMGSDTPSTLLATGSGVTPLVGGLTFVVFVALLLTCAQQLFQRRDA